MTIDQWIRVAAVTVLLFGQCALAWAIWQVGRAFLRRPPSATPGTLHPGYPTPEQKKTMEEAAKRLIEQLREKAKQREEETAIRNGMPSEDVMSRGSKVIQHR